MAGVYRPRHPERTVLYRVLFHHFERFVAEYEGRFEKEHGYFRPIIKEVVFTIPKMLRVFFKFKRRVWKKLKGTNLIIECGGNVIARHALREERYQDVPKDQL
jgi:hypothetical protein